MRVYSPLGDGSTDVSTTEQECVGLRISWGGLPRNEFIGLEALDLKDGRDGKSPDAQCLSKCYDRQMTDLLDPNGLEVGPKVAGAAAEEGVPEATVAPPGDHWLDRAVSCSFDGASVNTGELTGLISIWRLLAPWLLLVHGIAHVVELACSAAYDSISYFDVWKRYKYNDVWQAVHKHNDTGEKAKLLIEIEIAFALDTACAERWFSLMAILKDKKRNRLDDDLLNKLMFICLHAPKSILALKAVVNDIILIWKENKDRYKAKWATWEAVATQMECDELDINKDWQ